MIALLAISIAGCVIVPLDPAAPSARLVLMLEDSAVVICLCEADAEAALANEVTTAELLTIAAAISAGRAAPIRRLTATADHVHHLIYTSGSTGLPKAVAVSHESVAAYCVAKTRAHRVTRTSRVLLASAHTWDPFLGDVLSTLTAGATLISASRASVVFTTSVTHLSLAP